MVPAKYFVCNSSGAATEFVNELDLDYHGKGGPGIFSMATW